VFRTNGDQGLLTRTAATLAAVLFALQIFAAGFATVSVGADARSGSPGAACAPQTATRTPMPFDGGQPSAPAQAPADPHHDGGCCVLHCGAALPGARPIFAKPFRYTIAVSRPTPRFRIDAIGADPELASLSPRAPPARAA